MCNFIIIVDNRSLDRQIPQAHLSPRPPSVTMTPSSLDLQQLQSFKINDYSIKPASTPSIESPAMVLDSPTNKDLLALHNEAWIQQPPPPTVQPTHQQQHSHQQSPSIQPQHQHQPQQVQNLSARDTQMSTLNNGISQHQINQQPVSQTITAVGQENIVRVFDELMKNMARMKSFIRPAMCKPYGKQSESLQKSKHQFFMSLTLFYKYNKI